MHTGNLLLVSLLSILMPANQEMVSSSSGSRKKKKSEINKDFLISNQIEMYHILMSPNVSGNFVRNEFLEFLLKLVGAD